MKEKVSFNIASEASYVYILKGQKLIKNAKKWSILASYWKPEACGQIVLPDMSVLIGQKMVENAKIQKFKCDILSNFQTLWVHFCLKRKLNIYYPFVFLMSSSAKSSKNKSGIHQKTGWVFKVKVDMGTAVSQS